MKRLGIVALGLVLAVASVAGVDRKEEPFKLIEFGALAGPYDATVVLNPRTMTMSAGVEFPLMVRLFKDFGPLYACALPGAKVAMLSSDEPFLAAVNANLFLDVGLQLYIYDLFVGFEFRTFEGSFGTVAPGLNGYLTETGSTASFTGGCVTFGTSGIVNGLDNKAFGRVVIKGGVGFYKDPITNLSTLKIKWLAGVLY